MRVRRRLWALSACAISVSACSVSVESGSGAPTAALGDPASVADDATPISGSEASIPASLPADTAVATEPAETGPPDAPETTAPATTEAAATETSTTVPEAPALFDPACVVEVQEFDSLGLIANQFDDETVNVVALRAENNLTTADIDAGQMLDVCVGNGLDDVTGEQRPDPDEAVVAAAVQQNIEIQQLKLNKLFEGLGTPPLLVDGVSGPVTRQRLCAARLGLGLPAALDDMAAGSDEESQLFAARALQIPDTSALASNRWILIDRTCQIMFAGEGPDRLTFAFPTSTGSEGFETRDQDRSSAFRFDPAINNGGWHNSTTYPVAADNPLNGNMYRPLYFDLGQAIHGANNVPTTPQSKGCARLRVEHQDALVDWLDLEGATSPVWNANDIGVTVNVQGDYTG